MSLRVSSERQGRQEGIKSIYALHFQVSIHDKQNLRESRSGILTFSDSLPCDRTLPCHPTVSL